MYRLKSMENKANTVWRNRIYLTLLWKVFYWYNNNLAMTASQVKLLDYKSWLRDQGESSNIQDKKWRHYICCINWIGIILPLHHM